MKKTNRLHLDHYRYWPLFLLCISSLIMVACSGSDQGAGSGQNESLEAHGQILFDKQCDRCHSLEEGKTIVGPSLSGISLRAGTRVDGLDSGEYIRQSIMKPSAYLVDGFNDLMPSNFAQLLRPNEIDALVAYLLTVE